MRVLVVEIYGRGGLTHYTFNLVTELARRGMEVVLLTSCEYELAGAFPADLHGIRVEACFYRVSHRWRDWLWPLRHPRVRRWVKMLEYLLDTPRVVRTYRHARPAVVHLQGSNPILAVTLTALRRAGARVIYTAHDVPPLSNRWLSRALDGMIYRQADRIVVHSEADRKNLLARHRLSPEKVQVIQHGNYLFFLPPERPDPGAARRRLGLSEEDRVVLFFGFLSWYKGLDILLRSLPSVRRQVPTVRVLAVGDPLKLGPGGLAAYRRLARELSIETVFTLRAEYLPMEEVPTYFVAADCVALPYRQVSQSGVLHLAYAFGRPVVASWVGAFPETIREGETGFLVPPEDPEALGAALIRLLKDDDARARMGATARREADSTYSWGEVARHTEALYEEVARPC